MELMIPINSPVSRAITSYISLYINNISIYNLKESTSYFPYINYFLLNINNYLEIQARGLTDDLTPYRENETPINQHPIPKCRTTLIGSDSRTLDSVWGI
jgi:hypothetical protein